MKLHKDLIGKSFVLSKLPSSKKKFNLIVGNFYEVVSIKVKVLSIIDEDSNTISISSNLLNFELSFESKELKKKEFDEKNFNFNWIDSNLNVVLPDEFIEATEEDSIKEMGWELKADMFLRGHNITDNELELVLDFMKRKNKVQLYQDLTLEIDKRKEKTNSIIDELLQL